MGAIIIINKRIAKLLVVLLKYRSSRPEMFCKKGVLRNLTKFTGKQLCQNLFFNNVAGLVPIWKKETQAQVTLWVSCDSRVSFLIEYWKSYWNKSILFNSCSENQLTGFSMMTTLPLNELKSEGTTQKIMFYIVLESSLTFTWFWISSWKQKWWWSW